MASLLLHDGFSSAAAKDVVEGRVVEEVGPTNAEVGTERSMDPNTVVEKRAMMFYCDGIMRTFCG
jgi:hypothetical protein